MANRTNIFPCNTPQRIPVPLPVVPGSVPPARVIFGRERVNIFDSNVNAEAADDDGYFPINALYCVAPGCKPAECVDATVFVDDGLSRCSFYLNVAFIAAGGGTPVQQTMDWAVKVAAAGINNTLSKGSVSIKVSGNLSEASPTKGLIVTVSGIPGNQFEFWARIANTQGAQPVDVRIQMIADRIGGSMNAYKGVISGGGDLPTPP